VIHVVFSEDEIQKGFNSPKIKYRAAAPHAVACQWSFRKPGITDTYIRPWLWQYNFIRPPIHFILVQKQRALWRSNTCFGQGCSAFLRAQPYCVGKLKERCSAVGAWVASVGTAAASSSTSSSGALARAAISSTVIPIPPEAAPVLSSLIKSSM
jgi:hypothetical protein